MSRVAAGRAAKAAGDRFELWIEEHHERAKHLGIFCHVIHNEAHAKVAGGRLRYVAKGGADYSACRTDGVYCAIEAKSTADSYLPRSAIEPKQAEHLDAVAKAGGLALLLVEFCKPSFNRNDHYSVPWLQAPWKKKKKRTAESIDEDDLLIEWRIGLGTPCYLSRFFKGTGVPCGDVKRRVYARE